MFRARKSIKKVEIAPWSPILPPPHSSEQILTPPAKDLKTIFQDKLPNPSLYTRKNKMRENK